MILHVSVLGYIVFSGVRRSSGVQGLRVIVQSDKSPEYVESRVELFLHRMKVLLIAVSIMLCCLVLTLSVVYKFCVPSYPIIILFYPALSNFHV